MIGQHRAKRAVAVALRNRARRMHVSDDIADEIVPRNILMIGPTGVGKTEIARRLAGLSRSPFVKVEASKFTEVGYVGRDVESMVRDLVEVSIQLVRKDLLKVMQGQIDDNAEERVLDLLLPEGGPPDEGEERPDSSSGPGDGAGSGSSPEPDLRGTRDLGAHRDLLRGRLRRGELNERTVVVDVREPTPPIFDSLISPEEDPDGSGAEAIRGLFGPRFRRTEMLVADALSYFVREEEDRLMDPRDIEARAIERAEDHGIIFIDELDKVASFRDGGGPDVSREGVQRDLLPLFDGSSVSTRHGVVHTDHILFIAAGAFQENRPSDLLPELQGRFPIRVELDPLTVDDFERILTEPEGALLKQYQALLETEGLALHFRKGAIREIAEVAAEVNERMEDIGARRLHTVVERVLEDLLFDAPDLRRRKWMIDRKYVDRMLEGIVENEDLSRFIL